jgi:glycerol-3-phosphate dehydrogenase (NAD+)
VAKGKFSEATIGYRDKDAGDVWKRLFHKLTFRINTVDDVAGLEVCGALKNVVALGAGFCDGFGYPTLRRPSSDAGSIGRWLRLLS